MTQDKVVGIIQRLLKEIGDDEDLDLPERCDVDTPLVGSQGVLDSLALVSLIVALEQELEDEYGLRVSLADEQALSQRRSPYRTVGTLADYAIQAAVPAA